jgi:hypothetical protein
MVGALMPWIGWSAPSLAGLGGVAGALVAVGAVLIRAGWRRSPTDRSGDRRLIIICAVVFAAIVSHLVEDQFGIEVTTILITSAMTLAVLFVIAAGWVSGPASSTAETGPFRHRWGRGIVAAVFAAVLVFVFTIGRASAIGVLWARMDHQVAAIWLVLVSLGCGMVIAESRRGALTLVIGSAAGALGMLAVVWILRSPDREGAPLGTPAIAAAEADLVVSVLAAILASAVAMGWRISAAASPVSGERPGSGSTASGVRAGTAAVVCTVLAIGWLSLEARSLRSSAYANGAKQLAARHVFPEALDLIATARELAPRESSLVRAHARMLFDQGQASNDSSGREEAMTASYALLEQALRLAPYDADHVANLGRWHVAAAASAEDNAVRSRELASAVRRYRQALELRPAHMTWRREIASALREMGDLDPEDPRVRDLVEKGRRTLAGIDGRGAEVP